VRYVAVWFAVVLIALAVVVGFPYLRHQTGETCRAVNEERSAIRILLVGAADNRRARAALEPSSADARIDERIAQAYDEQRARLANVPCE